jgi:hypothetical protein
MTEQDRGVLLMTAWFAVFVAFVVWTVLRCVP